jgi:HEAT repeat protein
MRKVHLLACIYKVRSSFVNTLLASLLSCTVLNAVPADKQVLNYLILNDAQGACEEGRRLIQRSPEIPRHWEVYIQALSKKGEIDKALEAWGHYLQRFPEQKENRLLLESIAWGVIEQGSASRSPIIRSYAMLGAYFGQDARGVKLICKGLGDSNLAVRSLALKLSGGMRDESLQKEVLSLLDKDPNVQVRVEAIQAAGKMKIRSSEPYLIKLLHSQQARSAEKQAAIEALVSMYDKVGPDQVRSLASSSRAELRELACRVVLHSDMFASVSDIVPLLQDTSPNVKCAALQTIGHLRQERLPDESLVGEIRLLAHGSQPQVAITASWVLTLLNPSEGGQAFQKWLYAANTENRLFAAAALSATGKFGRPYLTEAFMQSEDAFTKMNLALGLIANGEQVDDACRTLYEGFLSEQGQWMWKRTGVCRVLTPSDVKHSGLIPNQPEVVNQMTRLEILNILAVKGSPHALDMAKNFLSRRQWGISGTASALLLQEGDESTIEVVQSLLHESDSRVRIQAALILAIWGRDEHSVNELQNGYAQADRELKERILEGLGHVGSRCSLAFLIQRLAEPQPSLRMIAAASLLQCLYH